MEGWLPRFLRWLASSAGLLGLLAAAGYLVRIAFDQRLGYSIGASASMSDLIPLAAEVFTEALGELSSVLFRYWALAATLVGVVLVAVALARRRQHGTARPLVSARTIAIVAVGILVIRLAFVDLPAAATHNLLANDVVAFQQIARPGPMGSLAVRQHLLQICARVGDAIPAPALEKRGVACRGPAGHRNTWAESRLQLTFAAAVATSLALAVVAGVLASSKRHPERGAVICTLVCAVVAGLALPYTYAKLRKPTIFDEVIVYRRSAVGADSVPHGFLLRQSADDFLLYSKTERHVWTIPRDQVVLIKTERRSDVLTEHFKASLGQAQPEVP